MCMSTLGCLSKQKPKLSQIAWVHKPKPNTVKCMSPSTCSTQATHIIVVRVPVNCTLASELSSTFPTAAIKPARVIVCTALSEMELLQYLTMQWWAMLLVQLQVQQ